MKKQLGVIFGSRSCEREVSIISAVQMMRHADPEKYDIIPIYIDEHGIWYTGESLKDMNSYRPFDPAQKGIKKVFLDMTSGSGALLCYRREGGLRRKNELEIAARIAENMPDGGGREAPSEPCQPRRYGMGIPLMAGLTGKPS